MDMAVSQACKVETYNHSVREARKLKATTVQLNNISNRTDFNRRKANPQQNDFRKFGYRNNNLRQFYGNCFICNQIGHRYSQCQKASPEEIKIISKNWDEYLNNNNYRAGINAKGESTNPQ